MSTYLIPLGMGIVPQGIEDKLLKNLIEKLEIDHQNHVGTGLIGGQWLMRGLTRFEASHHAYTIATQTNYPSWGYMIDKGATTIWELWNGDKARPDMNSGNHVMLLGDVIA